MDDDDDDDGDDDAGGGGSVVGLSISRNSDSCGSQLLQVKPWLPQTLLAQASISNFTKRLFSAQRLSSLMQFVPPPPAGKAATVPLRHVYACP